MFLSRENYIKRCQICKKIHIYTIFYKNSRFKQIIFSKYATNLKTIIFHSIMSANDSAIYCSHDFGLYIYILYIYCSDRCFICIIQCLRFSGFISYPLSFFLYSPFKKCSGLQQGRVVRRHRVPYTQFNKTSRPRKF